MSTNSKIRLDVAIGSGIIGIFVAGVCTLAWADQRYAHKDAVQKDQDRIQAALDEIRQDIKELLRRSK